MENSKINNPFVVGKYISDAYFCDREEETAFLRKQVENGRNTAIIAPRRLGKTDLIRHFFAQKDISEAYHTFFIDIYATSSLSEFVLLLGKNIFETLKPIQIQRKERFFEVIKSLRAGFKLDAVTGEPCLDIGLGNIEQPQTTLDEIFTYLETVQKPCIVAIDEFQQIAEYQEKNIEALLRTKIQNCKQTLFIFLGSRRHMMSRIFNSPSKPFYQSVITSDLRPLNKKVYVDFAVRQFANYGKGILPALVEQIYDDYQGITWYMQMLNNELFALTEKGTECSMNRYETALKNVIQTQEASYKEILSQLPVRQKPVLFAIAKEELAVNVTSGAFVKRYGLGSGSSVQAALKGLLEKDLVTRTEKGYQVYDRFFSTWIKWNY